MTDVQAPRPTPACARKTTRADETDGPGIEVVDGVWHVRSYALVKQVLRARDATAQAGFSAELARSSRPRARQPVLFQDGAAHRAQRSAIARYFAPKTVDSRYRALMETRADALVAELVAAGEVDLPATTLRYAVDVAAQVVGLTESDTDAMARRLEAFFSLPQLVPDDRRGRFGRIVASLQLMRAVPPMMRFRRHDVRPAIEARRTHPREDVISHLLAEGCSDEEILIECITYAAAGMVTTREFVSMATWHLLERPDLRRRYLEGTQPERYAVLDEILRLEPVVGHLYRRATAELVLQDGEQTHVLPEGALIDLYVRYANADETAVGPDPLTLCPGRELARSVKPEAMAFGDGPHVCPGNAIATQESDIFLTRLLALPIELVSEPRIEWDELIKGYAVRDLRLRVVEA